MKRFLALTSLLTFLAACASAGTGDGTIKIGFIGPLTGAAVSYGTDMLHAVQMRVEEVNAAGGINGRIVELVTEDGRCTGNDAASAAQKLIHVDKVVAVIGGACSSETLGAAPVAETAKVVQISPISSAPDIKDAGDFVFRTIPSDAKKGISMAAYIVEQGYRGVAMVSENTDYAVGIRDGIKNALPEGVVLILNETVEPGTKDFRALFARLEDSDFDVFVSNPQTDDVLAAMITQLREAGFSQPIVSQDIADSRKLLELAPEAAEGMRMFNTSSLLGTAGGEGSFAARFKAKYGEAQSNMSFATLSYDAAGVLFQAIGTAGTDGASIRDALYDLEKYEGAAGGFRFDEFGEVVGIENVLKAMSGGTIVELSE